DGVRYRYGQWLADQKTLVAISDETREERLVVFANGEARTFPWDIGRVVAMRAAPAGQRIALANHRHEVIVADIENNTFAVIDKSDSGRTEDLAWSPDGAWLAYTFWTSPRHSAIKLCDVVNGKGALVTDPEFRDYGPAFDPAGRYLYFLSLRTFDPVYDNVQFELSFPRAARPYLIALRGDGRPPFEPEPVGMQEDDKSARNAKHETPAVRVDLDGIVRRVAAFPVAEGRFGQIAGVAGDKVVWTLMPVVGAHGRGGHKDLPGRLELFDFRTLKTDVLVDRVDRFEIADDHLTLVLRDGKRLRAIRADRKPDPRERAPKPGDEPSRKSGFVDLSRVRLSVEPTREWAQMLHEVWRLQRDQFWVPDMSGIDWQAVYHRYEPLLSRISTRSELSDLIWEIQGELGTSHAYEMGGDYRKPPPLSLGHLAAQLRLADNGESYEIARIVEGDPWDASADSPLNAVGVQARIGERIVAVNGQPVSRERPPQSLLVHQARAKVDLALRSADGTQTRNVLVTTLADEVPARYREWVERNRELVHAQSEGRVGYLHLPDMMSAGFAEFHRYFGSECDRDALIVDLRYNRGGHVSQLLLEKVARRRVGYDLTRWGQPEPYPMESPAGAVVALTNEHAGSDGDIFSHCFKLMKIGPLLGTRTWGGVIGINPRHKLVDGTETTQPEFSFWFTDVGFSVENYGTDPDIEVDNAPQDALAGRDRQLDAALRVALDLAKAAAKPAFGERPVLRRNALPPRRLP
ncbi:MAG TPA: S41 family peptidase, partial [Casimicrobiaceae bacterium]|nr:S41 family peptidase [Casimicrobiaceae bacterium]